MDFRLKVQLYAEQKGCILQVALIVHGSLDDVACGSVQSSRCGDRSDVAGNLAAARCLTVAVGIGVVASRAHGGFTV